MLKYAQACLNFGKIPRRSPLLFNQFKCFDKDIKLIKSTRDYSSLLISWIVLPVVQPGEISGSF